MNGNDGFYNLLYNLFYVINILLELILNVPLYKHTHIIGISNSIKISLPNIIIHSIIQESN